MYDVAVRPEFQRGGVGSRLLEMLLSRLRVWRVILVSDLIAVGVLHSSTRLHPHDGSLLDKVERRVSGYAR